MTTRRALFKAAAVLLLPVIGTGASGTANAKRIERMPDGLQVNVDVGGQKMAVFVDGRLAHLWSISTGRDGYDTPGGTYRPQRLEREWFSKKYDNAPMPHSIFFSGGYAIHGTNDTRRLGRTASHGCIRLAPGNAARLFSLVEGYGAARTRIIIDN
jgi:lipoprotein-anchoring transpeptidase ErfK/SrfK